MYAGVPGGVASSSVTGQEPTVSIVDDSRTGESSSQIAPRHPLAVLGEAVIVMPVHRQPFVSSGDDKPLDIVEVEPQPDRPHVSKVPNLILFHAAL